MILFLLLGKTEKTFLGGKIEEIRGVLIKESSIEFQTERIEGVLVISISGSVSGLDAQEFHERLWEASGGFDKPVLLDLEGLAYINSAGLRSILAVAKRLRENKAKFAVCSLSRRTKSLFKMAAFDKVVDVFESRSEAIEAIRSRYSTA